MSNHLLGVSPIYVQTASANKTQTDDADQIFREVAEHSVKALLNDLSKNTEEFHPISEQIISWANKSEFEKDGRTLQLVVDLVIEKAADDIASSEIYAHLSRKMMERISEKVKDDGIRNNDGKPITGGHLFRKRLLNRCQNDLELAWTANDARQATTASEGQAAQIAKRKYIGLVKYTGELFKLQILTERIMHECIKALLRNVENPQEEDVESLCIFMTTVGPFLDVPKARAHMDVYFQRMKELARSINVGRRVQTMLEDVINLRECNWLPRAVPPTMINPVHSAAVSGSQPLLKPSYQPSPPSVGAGDEYSMWSFGPSADGFSQYSPSESSLDFSSLASQISDQTDVPPTTSDPGLLFGHISSDNTTLASMSEAQVRLYIDEVSRDLFRTRDLDEADIYLSKIPAEHQHHLVSKLIAVALESREAADSELVANFFSRAVSKGLCSPTTFEEGFAPPTEQVDDVVSDCHRVLSSYTRMMNGAGLDVAEERRARLTDTERLLKYLTLGRELVSSDCPRDVSPESDGLISTTTVDATVSVSKEVTASTVRLDDPVCSVQDNATLLIGDNSLTTAENHVGALLDDLSKDVEGFHPISGKIIEWANGSKVERDGRTLGLIVDLILAKATDDTTSSEAYARLSRKMMERISMKVGDYGVRSNEGKLITGGHLFRKYLLDRCQHRLEHAWAASDARQATTMSKLDEDEVDADTDQSTAQSAQRAKRKYIGLIRFIGELLNVQMLTVRIVHECIRKLLHNVDNPKEEDVESLCVLLTTSGPLLDVPMARTHMEIYFHRIKEMSRSRHIGPHLQAMLQDVLELRERKWAPKPDLSIHHIHDYAGDNAGLPPLPYYW